MRGLRKDDPDETEGRAIYRATAEALARAQLAYARRTIRLKQEDER